MSKVSLTYTSSNGQTFNLMASDIRLRTANFFSARWKPEISKKQFGGQVQRWTKDPLEYTMELIFTGPVEARKEALTAFWSAAETDILTGKTGVLQYQNATLEGYFAEEETYPAESQRQTAHVVSFYAPVPFWTTEQEIQISPLTDPEEELPLKTYDGGYSYDTGYHYPVVETAVMVNTDHYTESDFRMKIFGPTSNVNITMGGNLYRVNHSVGNGEVLVVDSRASQPADRRCYLIGVGGGITNIFNSRIGTLFNKLPPGSWEIDYSREYTLELTIYKRRSVPFWR